MTARRVLSGLVTLVVLSSLSLSGCRQRMADQPRHEPLEAAEALPGGRAAQAPPDGTVPTHVPWQRRRAPDWTIDELRRGRERFEIFCTPCHGLTGDGDGTVVRRGFPPPPSYHSDRLRQADDDHFYNVITNGYGIMYSYADRVGVADRWAIVAYIRALQLSQHANLEQHPELRARVEQGAADDG